MGREPRSDALEIDNQEIPLGNTKIKTNKHTKQNIMVKSVFEEGDTTGGAARKEPTTSGIETMDNEAVMNISRDKHTETTPNIWDVNEISVQDFQTDSKPIRVFTRVPIIMTKNHFVGSPRIQNT